MESALCLHYGPLPSPPRATRPHFTFSHSCPMLSYASPSHLRLKGYAFISPIVKQKAPSVRASAFPMGGKAALHSLFNAFLASSEIDSQKGSPFILPSRPSVEDVAALKMVAMQLLRSGKGTEAEEKLQKAIKNCEDDPEPEYNLSIALAEILIFQAKYKEAHECLKHQLHPSDGRFPLYKAIVHTMLDDKVEAKKWWKKFITIIEGGFDIPIEGEPDIPIEGQPDIPIEGQPDIF